MHAADIRRIVKVWQEYQKFKNTRKVGEVTVRELLETAPDAEAKKRVLQIVCGLPPYSSFNCGFLNWEVEKQERKMKKEQTKREQAEKREEETAELSGE